jgi:perosamine synthetase
VITTSDTDLATRLRLFRNHGITTDHCQREQQGSWFYEMVDLGYNYRLTDFQCALGLSQLTKLREWIGRRTEIAARYTLAFRSLPEVEPLTVLPDRRSAWHLYVVQLNLKMLRVNRAQIFQALRAKKLGVNVHYIPVHWHPYYQRLGYEKGNCPVAEAAYERLVTLPLFPAMSDNDVEYVINTVCDVVESHRVQFHRC